MNDRLAAAQVLRALAGERQQNRLLRLSFPRDDGPAAVMLANELIASEGMSRDFRFVVKVLSDDPNIELKDVQGTMVSVELVREDGSQRWFNGYVFEFSLVRCDSGCAFYDMVLLPWLAYLRLRHDNYLFHGKSLYDITADICRDYVEADWKTRVTGPDEPCAHVCMFNESDHNFLSRKWEEKGWHYWYEHRADGHTLVLGDDTLLADPIDGPSPEVPWQNTAGSLEDDGIDRLTPVRRIVPTSFALTSFDFKSPRPVSVDVPTLNQQGLVPRKEVYEYAGAYGFKNRADGDRLVRQRIEEIEARGKHFDVLSNDRYAQPGRWFTLTGHFDVKSAGNDPDPEFLILEALHEVQNNYLQNGLPSRYKNTLTCIRKRIPWRPGCGFSSTAPKIYGLQTAIVVGPKGEEIHTDEYGRIKVQFHWDREGRYDECSSAWIRVAQPWAGSGWGAIAIPRVGQEVVVQFLDGNPDRPLVTGCLFNAANMPPYELPAGGHMMGFKSNSSPGGGGYSEMVIHDAKGFELVNIHAQRDMKTRVLNNQSTVVHGPQQTVDVTTGKHTTTVKKSIELLSQTENIQLGAEAAIELVANTKHIVLKAKTDILLEVGESSLLLQQDGTIVLKGVTVTVQGSGKVDVNP